MRILVCCEESQAVTKAFRARGHEAFSADIQDQSGGHPEWHIMGDVLPLINGDCEFTTQDGIKHEQRGEWDMLIAMPPCTFVSNAGAVHLYPKGVLNQERLKKGIAGKEFFMRFFYAKCGKIAIENPTPSCVFNFPSCTQVIQPWQFGHPFSKRTCLWLKGLPYLNPTNILDVYESTKKVGNWFNAGGKDRQKNRSKFFSGIATAMADQWGKEKYNLWDMPLKQGLLLTS